MSAARDELGFFLGQERAKPTASALLEELERMDADPSVTDDEIWATLLNQRNEVGGRTGGRVRRGGGKGKCEGGCLGAPAPRGQLGA